jgi:flavin reductase ActVB
MPLDLAAFRSALGHFPSGVCVVTTIDSDERPWGFTASAFCSLSLDPPLILVCLDQKADSHTAFANAGHFAVSILASHQQSLAARFATKGMEKFSGITTEPGLETALPLIPEAVVHLECGMHQRIGVGDHTILVGEVMRAAVNESVEPLVYHARQYGVMRPHPAEQPA